MKNFSIEKYKKDGKPAFLDLIREILVPATPEEVVRQNTLLKLLNKWRVPKDCIKVEECLAHHVKGCRDRADAVLLHPKTKKHWVLYEFKAPTIDIDDFTLAQATRYNKIFKCKYVCLSNGSSEKWYFLKDGKCSEIKKPNNYKALLDSKFVFEEEEPTERPALECYSDKRVCAWYRKEGYIGDDTPSSLDPFILNFMWFLLDDSRHITRKLKLDGITVIKDGIRNVSFGNAGGGGYGGPHRYYLIEFPNGEHNIVSFGGSATKKCVKDPRFGNRNSYTLLNVAIDDYEKKHISLQLRLDNSLADLGSVWELTHNGSLTFGNKGSISRNTVINYLRKAAPDLVRGERVYLGQLPKNKLITWSNASGVVLNLIRYALLRDKLRRNTAHSLK